jgi:hypothetical protein
MTSCLSIPSSPEFEAVARGAQFRGWIALPVKASPEAIFRTLKRSPCAT